MNNLKCIGPESIYIGHFQVGNNGFNEAYGTVVDVDQIYPGSTGGKFKANAARACKQVEYCYFAEIKMVINNVEQAFL